MKTTILKVFTLSFFVVMTSCGDKAKEAETKAAEVAKTAKTSSIKYVADVNSSKIEWKGFKPTGSHNGTLAITSGIIAMNNNAIESGSFTINMNSLEVTDIPKEDEGNAKLAGHLKHADFFDVAQFPTSKFEITGVENKDGKTMLSGNLTIKDKTNNISFPVSTQIYGNEIKLVSETFSIDRSKWDIKYGSKSFFDNLGDRFINDDMEIRISVTAKKS